MKKQFISLMMAIAFIICYLPGCTDEIAVNIQDKDSDLTRSESCEKDSTLRLRFENETELWAAIEASQNDKNSETGTRASLPTTTTPTNFVSLVSRMPGSIDNLTYYEHMGYDSLVPNINFAKLLNIQGEMEMRDNIVKITPKGTFIVAKDFEKEFRQWLERNDKKLMAHLGTSVEYYNGKIKFIKTFGETPGDYTMVSTGNYTDLPDDYLDTNVNDDISSIYETRAYSQEPNFNDFAIFSADRKTVLGKIIQNLIGSTKTHTINYNKKLRLKGSFYFYNYGVYSEIGVKGWTDRKRTLNWTKTASDELRVGWRQVVIKIPFPSTLKDEIQKTKQSAYYEPQIVTFDDKRVWAATLIEANPSPDFWDKMIGNGVKGAIECIRSKYGSKATPNINQSEALIIVTPDDMKFIATDNDVIKYNEKSFCHIFSQGHMDITVGWNSGKGFFLNNLNASNADKLGTWIKLISDAFKTKYNTLVSGEVYICARFGDEWRGMKIIKKEN